METPILYGLISTAPGIIHNERYNAMLLKSTPTLCKCILTSNAIDLVIQRARFTLEGCSCIIQSPAPGGQKVLSCKVLLSLVILNLPNSNGVCPRLPTDVMSLNTWFPGYSTRKIHKNILLKEKFSDTHIANITKWP